MSDLAGTKGGPGVWQNIISAMPEHDVYVESFWGRGTIARKKRPAAVTIGLDLDPAAISDGGDVALMFRTCGMQWVADYFRVPLFEYLAAGSGGELTPSPIARNGGAAGSADTFGGFPWSRHFVYFDPPYLGCSGYYKFELTERQHAGLCWLFARLPCPAALSGYRSDLYDDALRDFQRLDIPTVNRAGRRVTECVWLNFGPPDRYHDVRYIGGCRRGREVVKRRVNRWAANFRRMPPAEQQAILAKLLPGSDAGSGGVS